MYETQIKLFLFMDRRYDIPTTEVNQLLAFNTDILRSAGISRMDRVRNIKILSRVIVTIDGVLHWI
jgi:hypothetical protein